MSTKYEILRKYRWRNKETLVVSHTKLIHWRIKHYRVNIWFLVYYRHENTYNIEVRTWENHEQFVLSKFARLIHENFITDQNQQFERERSITHKHKEALHIVAIEPVPDTTKGKPPLRLPWFMRRAQQDE